MRVKIKTKYVDEQVELQFKYYGDGSTAILGRSLSGEPSFKATVAIDIPARRGHVWLKGWSENEGIPEALVDAGIVKLTGITRETGRVNAIEAKVLKTK